MAGQNNKNAGKKPDEAAARKPINAEGLYGADEGFEDAPARADFLWYKPEDDDGNLIAIRGVVLGRYMRAEDPTRKEDQFFYLLITTTEKSLAYDREGEQKEVPKGTIVWVDEKFDLQGLAEYIPIKGEKHAHEVVIMPMEKIKHPKKPTQSIWRFHPIKKRKVAFDYIPGGTLPQVRVAPALGTMMSNEPLPKELQDNG